VRVLSRITVSFLAGAGLLAVGGALFGSAWATAGGCLVVFVVLAVHPAVWAVPPRVRSVLWAGLVLLGASVVVFVWGWADPSSEVDTAALIAQLRDPGWMRAQFQQDLLVAAGLLLGFGCLGGVTLLLSRGMLRAVPVAVGLTVLGLFVLALLPLFGSVANMAVATVAVLGGYGWLMRREVHRFGAVPIAAAGATLLATLAWTAAETASMTWPEPVEAGAFVSVGVVVDTGPDFGAMVPVGMLLLGAVATVLACARLSSRET
jgi:hypothetical protein